MHLTAASTQMLPNVALLCMTNHVYGTTISMKVSLLQIGRTMPLIAQKVDFLRNISSSSVNLADWKKDSNYQMNHHLLKHIFLSELPGMVGSKKALS